MGKLDVPSPVIREDATIPTRLQLPKLRVASWVVWIAATTLIWLGHLTNLFVYAAQSELHSYIPLVPAVSGYLLYLRRKTLPAAHRTSVAPTLILFAIGAAVLAAANTIGGRLSENDALALRTVAYVSVVAAGGFLFSARNGWPPPHFLWRS